MEKMADITAFESLCNQREVIDNRSLVKAGTASDYVSDVPVYTKHADLKKKELYSVLSQYWHLVQSREITVDDALKQLKKAYGLSPANIRALIYEAKQQGSRIS